ncbi:MAG: hypothetical protein ACRDJU_07425, partial [Actinomycetota bacterium]
MVACGLFLAAGIVVWRLDPHELEAWPAAGRLSHQALLGPGDVHPASGPPSPLLRQPAVEGQSLNLIDRATLWTLGSSPDATLGYVIKHPPRGLAYLASGPALPFAELGPLTVNFVTFSGPKATFGNPEVEVTVAAHGSGSAVRV